MKQVKITVLRKQLYEDLAELYLTDGKDVACDFYQEGDTFLYTGGAEMPAGFCPWAWVDLYPRVSALSAGATHTPWQRRDGVNVVCCSDGIRPVTFLLEALEEPTPPGDPVPAPTADDFPGNPGPAIRAEGSPAAQPGTGR